MPEPLTARRRSLRPERSARGIDAASHGGEVTCESDRDEMARRWLEAEWSEGERSFLGYSFRGKLRFPRAKSHRKFVDRIRELTPRKSGHSLEFMLQRINRTTRGWFNYFRHCQWSVFRDYDGMIRRRLRRMLLKRHRRNRKRLPRNRRWPNTYFTERGYISLNASHVRFVESIGTY